MEVKTNKKSGDEFWGCTKFHETGCKGNRDIGYKVPEKHTTRELSQQSTQNQIPVEWPEREIRSEFFTEYLSIGSVPGVLSQKLERQSALQKSLTQSLILYSKRRGRENASPHARLVSVVLQKILQRGRAPFPSLGIERSALDSHSLLKSAVNLALESDGTEMGWEFQTSALKGVTVEGLLSAVSARRPFSIDAEFISTTGPNKLFDSDSEVSFFTRWVPENLGPVAAHWFTPQASLDTLRRAHGIDASGARRVDFLFHHPTAGTIAIEIDGPEHEQDIRVDRARDKELRQIGIDVIRITHDEFLQGKGPSLDRLKHICKDIRKNPKISAEDSHVAAFLIDCATATKVQLAIARAVGWGWLTGGKHWSITLTGSSCAISSGVLNFLQLLSALDRLYGGTSIPQGCAVCLEHGDTISFGVDQDGTWREIDTVDVPLEETLRVVLESDTSPYHKLSVDADTDVILRPAFLPVEFRCRIERPIKHERQPIQASSYDHAQPALQLILQEIFRKGRFRSMQGEAVYNCLRHQDSIVLLPTGAGKSLIYQLAGLLMPGVTIVVDPIVALMEDQVEGLRRYGIDRAAPIARSIVESMHPTFLRRVEAGEYFFVLLSPERLQSENFRATLQTLLVNLAVIDEAHCISEWGHDFRPAYLQLSDNLSRFCTGFVNSPPPVLALTGTASAAVLQDMIIELKIDARRPGSLVQPDSFDRSELSFEIVRFKWPRDSHRYLGRVLDGMSEHFDMPHNAFYTSDDRNTKSGIVFVPTVNRDTGLLRVQNTVREATNATVGIFSGGCPEGRNPEDWELEKRRNAGDFKNNEVTVLVTTNAFGMGIDKPNIRYIIHFGMPSSLESYYQEAGRAGRDGKRAHCVVLFSEYHKGRSENLLNPAQNFKDLQRLCEEADKNFRAWDDVTRALYFHRRSYRGLDAEIQSVRTVIDQFEKISVDQSEIARIPFKTDDEDSESLERTFCRLQRIGAISDYQIETGSNAFTIEVEPFDFPRQKRRLLDYIVASQPALHEHYSNQLEQVISENPYQSIFELARILITFIYDVIERSRRGMIQEAILLARDANGDAEIRSRLEDYLQGGLDAKRVRELASQPQIVFEHWLELVEKCETSFDSGKLRGLCARAIETYPDHPGLLLCRAVSEVLCSSHDQIESSKWFALAVQVSVEKYLIATDVVADTLDSLFELALNRDREVGISLIVGLTDLDPVNEGLSFAIDRAKQWSEKIVDERDNEDSLAAPISLAIQDRRRVVNKLETVIRELSKQYAEL